MTEEAPTAQDYASIERAVDELERRGWRRRFSIDEVVNGWASFVHSVEEGYDWTIDEFTNDVSLRRWAEEAGPLLSPLVRQSMDARLEPLDDRFRAATYPALRPLPGAGITYWWETRLPNLLVGELAEDVERMGLGPSGG